MECPNCGYEQNPFIRDPSLKRPVRTAAERKFYKAIEAAAKEFIADPESKEAQFIRKHFKGMYA